jgi:hypothetical protein
MFTRLILILTTITTVISAAALILIRAQPHDTSEMERFLISDENCSARCWQGIHPGETTPDDALNLLQAHPWVDVDTIVLYDLAGSDDYDGARAFIYWQWNGTQPDGLVDPGRLNISGGRISSIIVHSEVPLGEWWLLLGKPDGARVETSRALGYGIFIYWSIYNDRALTIRSQFERPAHRLAFWQSPVNLRFGQSGSDRDAVFIPCPWIAC